MNTVDPKGMCPNSAQVRQGKAILGLLTRVWTALLALAGIAAEQQKRPPANRRALPEPPKGIEPLTYSLRVNRSGRLS